MILLAWGAGGCETITQDLNDFGKSIFPPSPSEAARMALEGKPDATCKEIVDACAKRWDGQMPGRRDDITTVVVDLKHADLQVVERPPASPGSSSAV